MGKFNWQPWARYQGLGAGFFILTGGVISIWYPTLYIAIINIVTGLLIMAMDYPLIPFDRPGFVTENLYLRFVLYLAFSVAAFLDAPTSTGGACLFCCSIVYLRAAINGEKGGIQKPPPKKK